MPYISQQDRLKFYKVLNEFYNLDTENITPGELNYMISSMLWYLFENQTSYTKGNEILGVLEGVKHEFYRRKLSVYEDNKIEENGDVT